MDTPVERTKQLNDAFRSSMQGGRVMLTAGIQALGESAVASIVGQVRSFDAFTPDNDPHGEHDFGSFPAYDTTVYFKIDYYDTALAGGSEDPSDPEKTTRVLTILLASEY